MDTEPGEPALPTAAEARPAYDFSLLFQAQRAMFSVAGADGFLREINPAFERLVGRSRDQLLGHSIFEFIVPEDIPLTLQGLSDLEDGETDVGFENRWMHADGSVRSLEWVAKSDPQQRLWFATARDVTESRQTQESLRKVQQRLTLALSVAQAGSWEHNFSDGLVHLDAGAEVLMGLSAAEGAQSFAALLRLVHRADRRRLLGHLRAVTGPGEQLIETDFRLQDDTAGVRHIALRGRVVSRDRRKAPLQAIGIAFDVTNQKALEEQLLALVMYDPLTAIRNRRSFDQSYRAEWKRALKSQRPLAVLMIDVDEFKRYNDQQGHQAGDEVLCAVARTLGEGLQRSEDIVARYGGEEFIVLLPGAAAPQATLIAERLLGLVRAAAMPHPSAEAGIVTVSIGVASQLPSDGGTAAALINAADSALYRAKAAGRNRVAS